MLVSQHTAQYLGGLVNIIKGIMKVIGAGIITALVLYAGKLAYGIASNMSMPEAGELSDTFSAAEQYHGKLPWVVAVLAVMGLGLACIRAFAEKVPEGGPFGKIVRLLAYVFGFVFFVSLVASSIFAIHWFTIQETRPELGELPDTFSRFEQYHAWLPKAAAFAVFLVFALALLQKRGANGRVSALKTSVVGPTIASTGGGGFGGGGFDGDDYD